MKKNENKGIKELITTYGIDIVAKIESELNKELADEINKNIFNRFNPIRILNEKVRECKTN